jgi:hypothetical protein
MLSSIRFSHVEAFLDNLLACAAKERFAVRVEEKSTADMTVDVGDALFADDLIASTVVVTRRNKSLDAFIISSLFLLTIDFGPSFISYRSWSFTSSDKQPNRGFVFIITDSYQWVEYFNQLLVLYGISLFEVVLLMSCQACRPSKTEFSHRTLFTSRSATYGE